jgi:glycosyltransferase involved in cell wall biosynthesis
LLLAANARTREALTRVSEVPIEELAENGVDESLWKESRVDPQSQEDGSSRTVFGFIGRLVALKCVDVLIEAFANADLDSSSLVILGDGPQRKRLEALARRYPDKDILFTGFLSQLECAKRLAEIDVLVMPSVHECGGAVVLEAMCCGKPVIAAKWGGPADYLDDETGILVEPSSREALLRGLSESMITLHRAPELRRTLGTRARDVALAKYTWAGKIQAIQEIYESIHT